MTDILTALAAPFPPEIVSWRVGSTTQATDKGLALAYIDSRDVQDRLNDVCGVNWQVRHPWAEGSKLACEIGILIDGEWIWRGDGAGDSDVEAEKGAFSDSFKRAAVRWGIGRYLYDIESPWVAITARGKSYVIADGEIARLRGLLARKASSPTPTASRAPAATGSGAAATPKSAGRDEAFFNGKSYEIDPRAAGSWSKWEAIFRARALECLNHEQWAKLEDDNLKHRNIYTAKADAKVCDDLLEFCRTIDHKLLPGIAA